MKSLKQVVTEFVEGNKGEFNAEVDTRTLQAHLFTYDFSMQLIVRELPKVLVQLALMPDPVESLKGATAALKEELPMAVRKGLVGATITGISNRYKLPERTIVKAVRKIDPNALQPKPRLGAQKTAIIEYFKITPEPTLKGLATYLQTTLPTDEEKALKIARMNFTFANEMMKVAVQVKK